MTLPISIITPNNHNFSPNIPTAITIGVFDGVHIGHRFLISQLVDASEGLTPVAVSLLHHPANIFNPNNKEYWLDTPQTHNQMLFNAGAKAVATLDFNLNTAKLSACETLLSLKQQLNVHTLMLGYDSRFGSKMNDDFDHIEQYGNEIGVRVLRARPYLFDGKPVSSSRIRALLQDGNIKETNALLGRKYFVHGRVIHGRNIGHTIGFPTANLDTTSCQQMLPKEGVYMVEVNNHFAVANLGPQPTFGSNKAVLEVHILDYNEVLYDEQISVYFIDRIRDIRHFSDKNELIEQIKEDINFVKSNMIL